jgi:hypothetical protein
MNPPEEDSRVAEPLALGHAGSIFNLTEPSRHKKSGSVMIVTEPPFLCLFVLAQSRWDSRY